MSLSSITSFLSPSSDELIIFRILYEVESNVFASLALLNRRWREVSQDASLYAYHLSRCPSFALSNSVLPQTQSEEDLPRLRGKFAIEVRRNCFEAYLRPRKTLVKLISTSTSSSSAFPGGEAFQFVFSPNGRLLLAISSSRIHILDLTARPVQVVRELKTLRRTLSAAILDDGSCLAVLSSTYQVSIYSLGQTVEYVKSINLYKSPSAITLSAAGTLLAAAYDGGVEVFSLVGATNLVDRRAVRCSTVNSLSFSHDTSMLLGSTTNLNSPDPNVTTITAAFTSEADPTADMNEMQSRMWSTQILIPSSTPKFTHASFLPSHNEAGTMWLTAFDQKLGTYRATQASSLDTGVAYLLRPVPRSRRFPTMTPQILPAANRSGDLVVSKFEDHQLYLYGIPEKIDVSPNNLAFIEPFDGTQVESPRRGRHGARINRDPSLRLRASLLAYSPPSSAGLDNYDEDFFSKVDEKNGIFIEGHALGDLKDMTQVMWVTRAPASGLNNHSARVRNGQRLVAVAPGGVDSPVSGFEDGEVPADGGRLLFYDFEYSTTDGVEEEIIIELGATDPERLPEPSRNLEAEVAIERRRTQRQRNEMMAGIRGVSLNRAVTDIPASDTLTADTAQLRSTSQPITPPDEEETVNEILELPYAQGEPRSRSSIQRAATAASAVAARRVRDTRRGVQAGQIVYRRAPDGTLNALVLDNGGEGTWEHPPPPYTPDADEPLPQRLQQTFLRPEEPYATRPESGLYRAGINVTSSPTPDPNSSSARITSPSQHYLPPDSQYSQTSPRRAMTTASHGYPNRSHSLGVSRDADIDPANSDVSSILSTSESLSSIPSSLASNRRPLSEIDRTHRTDSSGSLDLRATVTSPLSFAGVAVGMSSENDSSSTVLDLGSPALDVEGREQHAPVSENRTVETQDETDQTQTPPQSPPPDQRTHSRSTSASTYITPSTETQTQAQPQPQSQQQPSTNSQPRSLPRASTSPAILPPFPHTDDQTFDFPTPTALQIASLERRLSQSQSQPQTRPQRSSSGASNAAHSRHRSSSGVGNGTPSRQRAPSSGSISDLRDRDSSISSSHGTTSTSRPISGPPRGAMGAVGSVKNRNRNVSAALSAVPGSQGQGQESGQGQRARAGSGGSVRSTSTPISTSATTATAPFVYANTHSTQQGTGTGTNTGTARNSMSTPNLLVPGSETTGSRPGYLRLETIHSISSSPELERIISLDDAVGASASGTGTARARNSAVGIEIETRGLGSVRDGDESVPPTPPPKDGVGFEKGKFGIVSNGKEKEKEKEKGFGKKKNAKCCVM